MDAASCSVLTVPAVLDGVRGYVLTVPDHISFGFVCCDLLIERCSPREWPMTSKHDSGPARAMLWSGPCTGQGTWVTGRRTLHATRKLQGEEVEIPWSAKQVVFVHNSWPSIREVWASWGPWPLLHHILIGPINLRLETTVTAIRVYEPRDSSTGFGRPGSTGRTAHRQAESGTSPHSATLCFFSYYLFIHFHKRKPRSTHRERVGTMSAK